MFTALWAMLSPKRFHAGAIRDPHPLHKPATPHKKRTEGSILFFDLPQSLCDSDSKSFPMDFRRNIALAASTDTGKIKRICRIWNRSQLKQERNFPLVYFSIRESGFSGRIRDQRYFSRDIGNVPLEIRTYSDRKKTRQRRPLKIYIAAVGDDIDKNLISGFFKNPGTGMHDPINRRYRTAQLGHDRVMGGGRRIRRPDLPDLVFVFRDHFGRR